MKSGAPSVQGFVRLVQGDRSSEFCMPALCCTKRATAKATAARRIFLLQRATERFAEGCAFFKVEPNHWNGSSLRALESLCRRPHPKARGWVGGSNLYTEPKNHSTHSLAELYVIPNEQVLHAHTLLYQKSNCKSNNSTTHLFAATGNRAVRRRLSLRALASLCRLQQRNQNSQQTNKAAVCCVPELQSLE